MTAGLNTQPRWRERSHCCTQKRKAKQRGYYGVCDWLLVVRRTYVCDHLPSGLVPLSVVGPLQFLLEHTLSGGTVLQGKFTQDFAEAVNGDLARRIHRVAQEQEKGVEPADTQRYVRETRETEGETQQNRLNEPVHDSSVYSLQNDDPLCTVFEEIGHFLLQHRLHLVLGYDLEVIPRCFASPLHLDQVVLKLIKVHLTRRDSPRLRPTKQAAIKTQCCLLETDLGQAGDGADLRVEVSAVWKLLHHDGADVMQQRLLVHSVLHFWDLFQVAQLKAFSLECKHSSTVQLWDYRKSPRLKAKLQLASLLAAGLRATLRQCSLYVH